MAGGFKIIDHTGDIGIKVWGKSQGDLFIEAATAMTSFIIDGNAIQNKETWNLNIEGVTMEDLLLNWLREILFLIEKGVGFKGFQIEKNNLSEKKVDTYFINAVLSGERLNPNRHEICNEIKAVTRHDLYIKKHGEWWETNILFDV